MIRFGQPGEQTVLASGCARPGEGTVTRGAGPKAPDGETSLFVDEPRAVDGRHPPAAREGGFPCTGIAVEPHSHLVVERFAIQGKPRPAVINYLFSEAILGAGGSREDWQELRGPEFRYGVAALAKRPEARVKWNVKGRQFTLWSPRGPEFGKAQVKVDGRVAGAVDLQAEQLAAFAPVWKSARLKDGPHAVVLTATEGQLVVDSLEVTD